jgi:nitrogen fixation NifU-like protein
MVTGSRGQKPEEAIADQDFDRLRVIAGVKQFPLRVKCATLAWHAMRAALNGQVETSTE